MEKAQIQLGEGGGSGAATTEGSTRREDSARSAGSSTPEVVLISAGGVSQSLRRVTAGSASSSTPETLQPEKKAKTGLSASYARQGVPSSPRLEIELAVEELGMILDDSLTEWPEQGVSRCREVVAVLEEIAQRWGAQWKERGRALEQSQRERARDKKRYTRRIEELEEERDRIERERDDLWIECTSIRRSEIQREDTVWADASAQTDPLEERRITKVRVGVDRPGSDVSTQTDPSAKEGRLEERVSRLETLFSSYRRDFPSLGGSQGGGASGEDRTNEGEPGGEVGRKESWREVVGRKGKRKGSGGIPPSSRDGGPSGSSGGAPTRGVGVGRRVSLRGVPTAEAVVITCKDKKYEETMRFIRSKVKPADVGIEGLRQRRTATGALLFEIEGKDGRRQADALANKVREVVANSTEVVVSRPRLMGEIKVSRLADSISLEEVIGVISERAQCPPEDVSPVGGIVRAGDGLGVLWVRLPMAAARRAAQDGRIPLGEGWFRATVTLLGPRPLQCYRCLEVGHVAVNCRNEIDRSKCCYRCGGVGHRARGCEADPKCPVCSDVGLPCDHRLGGGGCASASAANVGTGGRPRRPAPPTRSQGEGEDVGGRGAQSGPGTSSAPPGARGGLVTTPRRRDRVPMEVEEGVCSTPPS